MKIILQRAISASVTVDGRAVGSIVKGYAVFLGIGKGDTKEKIVKMVNKIKRLRIFPDENGKVNLSAGDINGEILVISQFTLYADCKKGNRPSFTDAGSPALAEELYDYFIKISRDNFIKAEHGAFGAHMAVELINDGPFTVILED